MALTIDDDDGGDNKQKSFDSSVSCSICLDVVADNGDRSFSKLQCGHQFHLDCIGSAFNIKGVMQCPNCRKIEKGQWLYANGCRSYPESSMDDWTRDDEIYDLGYSEMSLWCPYGSFTRLPFSFEEREFSSTPYHDVVGQHAMFHEHSAVSSGSHPCPYVAYIAPVHPSTSISTGTVSEVSNFNHWSGPSLHGDMSTSYPFPTVVLHYHSWDHHSSYFSSASSPLGAADQPSISTSNQRPARGGSEVPRSGFYMHPSLVGHGHSSARAGNSVASSMTPPYQGSNARSRDRAQALQAYYQPQQLPSSTTIRTPVASSTWRSSSRSGSSPLESPGFVYLPNSRSGSSPLESPGFVYLPNSRNFQEETHLPTHFHNRERDNLPSSSLNQVGRESSWRAYHQSASGSDPVIRSTSSWLRNNSERAPYQNL